MKASSLVFLEELMGRFSELAGQREVIAKTAEMICECHRAGKTVLICGNGGSAADSEHIVGELMKGFRLRRPMPQAHRERLKETGVADWENIAASLQQGVRAIALTGHIALSTAVLNDNDPYMVFAQQVYVYGSAGDVLIALSTSGEAKNVLNATKVARAVGMKTIGLTGMRHSSLDALCTISIKTPAEQAYCVQEYHLPIYHTICLMIEEEIFGSPAG